MYERAGLNRRAGTSAVRSFIRPEPVWCCWTWPSSWAVTAIEATDGVEATP